MPNFISTILNWIFPPLCVHCQREGAWWCSDATKILSTSPIILDTAIPGCDRVVIRASYDYQAISAGIQKLKYHYWTGIQPALIPLLEPLVSQLETFPPTTVIVPVPLHPQRIRVRGFNQSQLIAHALATLTSWSVQPLVRRTKATRPQVQLSAEQRQSNVLDAFVFNSTRPVPTDVLLVDDVITTGATVTACARTLRKAGVQRIYAAAIAKG